MSGGAEPIVILVVEDESLVLDIAVDIAVEAGFKVETAANADEAIEAIERNAAIRIVFTDVRMPGSMDGIRLATYIRGRWPPIRLIVTSAALGPYQRPPTGARFLSKPYSMKSLTEALKMEAAEIRV